MRVPDEFGRFSRAEMQQRIWRNLSVFQPGAVSPTTGYESGTPVVGANYQFSADNINSRINSSITKASRIISLNNLALLRREVFYDAIPSVFEYAIPPDCIGVASLWWLSPSAAAPSATPEDYVFMSYQEVEDDGNAISGVNVSRPTWRLGNGGILLNQDPGDWLTGVQAEGIWVKYRRRLRYLATDEDYLEPPFANEVQEFVILDTVLSLVAAQDESVDVSGVEKQQQYWSQQLELAARNFYTPPEIQLKGPAIVKNSWSGHWAGRGNRNFEQR